MADYDLLSEDDFFSQSEPSTRKEKEKPKEEADQDAVQPTEEDDLFKDIDQTIQKSIEELPLDKEEAGDDLIAGEASEESFEAIKQELEDDEGQIETDEGAAPAPLITDYEDEKQEKISYKPFIIGGTIVIFLIVLFIVLYNLYWTGGQEKTEEKTPAKQEAVQEKPAVSPEELQKQKFYGSVYGKTKKKLNLATGFVSTANKNAKLTSFLIYGDDMMYEIFSPDREKLAKYSLDVRDRFPGTKVILDNTSIRPGKNGGVFGLFRVQQTGSSGEGTASSVTNPFTSAAEAQRWLTSLADYNKLKVGKTRNKAAGKKASFAVYEIEAEITGSFEGCNSFLQSVANSGKNVEIYKLTFNAVDQKSFKSSKYQLKLILKVYI